MNKVVAALLTVLLVGMFIWASSEDYEMQKADRASNPEWTYFYDN